MGPLPPAGSSLITENECKHITTDRGFGRSEQTYRMLAVPHLLGALSGRTAPVSIWGAGSGHAAAAQQLAGYSALQGTARGNCNGTMPIEPK